MDPKSSSGFNVEGSTFKYSGRTYDLNCKLIDIDTLKEDGSKYEFNMSNGGIQMLEIANGFNELVLEATLEYSDPTGQVMSFVGRQNVACNIDFVEIHQDYDQSFGSDSIRPERSFKHQFIVKKLEIVDRSTTNIKYKILLVSIDWLKLVSNITFSNYDSGKQGVFEILKQCLVYNGLNVNGESFDQAGSAVQLSYATSGSENVITIFNYLMSRLYYYADSYEEVMKFLWIDHIAGTYNIFDFSKPASAKDPKNLIITTNPASTEKVAEQDPNELGSMSAFQATDFYESLFQRKIFKYSYDANQFESSMITDDQILQYSNTSLMMQAPNTLQYFKTPSAGEFTSRHLARFSDWQNESNIYAEQAKSLLAGRSIVVNTSGNITWKPTMVVNLLFQKDIREVKGESQKEYDNWDKTYAGLNGSWIISKVRHIIQPNDKKKYRQNLVLTRNFKMPVEAKK